MRNIFTNIPVEFKIPSKAKVVFVSDLFAEDLLGGAELTTQALIQSNNTIPTFCIHCTSLNIELLTQNKDKHFVICNFSRLAPEVIEAFSTGNYKYSIIEYDFKYCCFRSEQRHQMETGQMCNCYYTNHGAKMVGFYKNATTRYWMSELQKKIFENRLPTAFSEPDKDIVLSSVFLPETLDLLRKIRTSKKKEKTAAILAKGGSWMKGVDQAEKWCREQNIPFVHVSNKNYEMFLRDLSQYSEFVFMPLDWDTCPRVVIEAKLLGMNIHLNDKVLHQNEPWFSGTIEATEEYLRQNATQKFWNKLPLL